MSMTSERESKGLRAGAIGLVGSIVVGIASTAPGLQPGREPRLDRRQRSGVGVKAASIVLLAFVPIYLIAVAYQELNKAEPDCGTTFTWASRAFGPLIGWMGGWGIIAADVIVMANLAQIAGRTRSPSSGTRWPRRPGEHTLWSTVAGVIWIPVMTYICYRGIEVSARLQYFLARLRGLICAFSLFALVKVYTGDALRRSNLLSWFSPAGSA